MSTGYNLRGKPPLIHRVVDACATISFVGVEVRTDIIPDNGKHATLMENIADSMNATSDFATASSITIPPGESLELARNQGIMPSHSVLVPLTDGYPITALKVEHAKSVRNVLKLNKRFHVAAAVVENIGPFCEKEKSFCKVSNLASDTWTGAIVDVWTAGH